MLKKRYFLRSIIIFALFITAIFTYVGRILNMQFANAELYTKKIVNTYTRKIAVPALRGEIYDRNGVLLVRNKPIYKIRINGIYFKQASYKDKITSLLEITDRCNAQSLPDTLPIIEIINQDGSVGYSYSMVLSTSEDERKRLDRFLVKNELDVKITAPELITFLQSKYKLQEYEGNDFRRILGICYDFDRLDILSGNIYIFATDINMLTITSLKESAHDLPGVEVLLSSEREYMLPGVATHILGSVKPIYKDEYEDYKDKGYSMDAMVGKGGVEQAFEEYLRGTDGILERTYDQEGRILKEEYKNPPVAGKNVYLTLDIKMQQVAEHSLAQTLDEIHEIAAKANKQYSGEDADAGSAVLTDPNNGEIYVLATYPSYDMTLTVDKAYYQSLLDDKRNPLVNRALYGLYTPGSIFKVTTSTAALCEGVLTTTEKIYDKGIYTKYTDYQPRCWLYTSSHASHGNINVSQAIRDSCNYFFYTVGERIGITKLNEYSRKLGLGVSTGIEIGETKGILASREYKESHQSAWFEGDLLQAAIGQSDNAFSPLQMSQMLSTVINGGTRYAMHLLYAVKEYDTGNIVYSPEVNILDKTEINETYLTAVKNGLADVIEAGTANSLFRGFKVKVSGKTGTAQVRKDESNFGTFVCFAPFEKPEVTMSVVIERSSKGTYAGFVAEDVLAYYFGAKTFEESMGLPTLEEAPSETPPETTTKPKGIS